MSKIEAPFTPEQVEKLKQWQRGMLPLREGEDNPVMLAIGGQPVHPFTCCAPDFCKLKEKTGFIAWLRRLIKGRAVFDNSLIPTTEGWVCPCGRYKQNWCHDIMVE